MPYVFHGYSTKSLLHYILLPIIHPTVVIICCICLCFELCCGQCISQVVFNHNIKQYLPKVPCMSPNQKTSGFNDTVFYTSGKEEKQRENWTSF